MWALIACLGLVAAYSVVILYGRLRFKPSDAPRKVAELERGPELGRDVDSLTYNRRPLSGMIRSLENRDSLDIDSISEILDQIGPEAEAAIPRLIGVLRVRDTFSALAIKGLSRIGKPAIPALIEG